MTTTTKNRINVSVVRETKKALLVEADGRQGWIQRRWMRADNTVSATTFDRSAKEAAARQTRREGLQIWKDSFHAIGDVARETEKAVGVQVEIECVHTHQRIFRMVWWPKSQLRDGKAPGWLIIAKHRDLRDDLGRESIEIDGLPSIPMGE